jgi:uracil-DNA glycosylase family 4
MSLTKQQKLDLLNEKVKTCQKCPVLCQSRTQTVFGVGNPDTRIVFCGEAPGKDEDASGEPFVGRAGSLLNNILAAAKIKREDIYILNVCKCRPPSNRTPLPAEADNCRPFLELQLRIINPEYIVALGACAAQNLLKTKTGISNLRKQWHVFEAEGVRAKTLCTFHPAYVLRNPAAKKDVWDDMLMLLDDLKNCGLQHEKMAYNGVQPE